ncbi:winged helix-turn-helix domain-containing protein [Actinocatenispora sera]|uniref:winged helix-turn-helix domain-containing protein n=1 Tax=Actinocatenispora sera TaxID=390989 RepID=UPI0033F1D913
MTITVDIKDPTPVYQQIASQLEQLIRSGRLRPGQRMPSETTLVQETGAARTTVRHAMKTLRDKGLIETIPARGSWVKE